MGEQNQKESLRNTALKNVGKKPPEDKNKVKCELRAISRRRRQRAAQLLALCGFLLYPKYHILKLQSLYLIIKAQKWHCRAIIVGKRGKEAVRQEYNANGRDKFGASQICGIGKFGVFEINH